MKFMAPRTMSISCQWIEKKGYSLQALIFYTGEARVDHDSWAVGKDALELGRTKIEKGSVDT
jgi:hypothetical protein